MQTKMDQYRDRDFFTGDITYIFELIVESMVWLDDFSNKGSLAYQQLAAKFQKAVGTQLGPVVRKPIHLI